MRKIFSNPSEQAADVQSLMEALKASGVVIPNDLSIAAKVSSELSAQGTDVAAAGPGGLMFTHYVLVWSD
jgi:phospholipid N-methyltransferase